MDEEFDHMVTPLVFDLQMKLESRGWEIEKVFGSPEADEATGELMRINTLFPSKKEAGETRGGLVLLKLKKTLSLFGSMLKLTVNYEDRIGDSDSSETIIALDGAAPEFFENNGIRKGVLLARYASLLKNWMIDERQYAHWSSPWEPSVDDDRGICIPPEPSGSQWERQSLPLMVADPYQKVFREFAGHFEDEMYDINDDNLEQELEILDYLSRYR